MKKRPGIGFQRMFLAVVTVILIAIMLGNIVLMFDVASEQTQQIGQMRMQNIAASLQKSLTRAENTLGRVCDELEELLTAGATREEIRAFLSEQKERELALSGGVCLNVFCVVDGSVLISGMQMPEEYFLQDRIWYRGLLANRWKETYISSAYDDAFTDGLCFTVARLMDDGKTIAAVDYSVAEIQSCVAELGSDGYGEAIIIDENETIVGYDDPQLIGQKLSSSLPQYRDVFLQAVAAGAPGASLRTQIGGQACPVFCNRTENGWYLLCSVSDRAMYGKSYSQLLRNFIIVLLLVLANVAYAGLSIRHRRQIEDSLRKRSDALGELAERLSGPLNEILEGSGGEEGETGDGKRIHEAGLSISRILDELPAPVPPGRGEKARARKRAPKQTDITIATQRMYQFGITVIFVITMVIAIAVNAVMTTSESRTKMESELREYNYAIADWILEQKSILDMFVNVISAKPQMLEDYDGMVRFLDDIVKHYPKISAAYIANPDYPHGHPMVMNNGWVPEPDYVEEERLWYIGALTAEEFSITEPYYDARTGEYCMTFSRIVESETGEFYGIFAIDFYLDVLMDILGGSFTENGYAFLVDKNGLIIDHPYSEYRFSDEDSENIHNLAYERLYQRTGLVSLRDYDGRYKVCAAMDEPMSGFRLFVVKDWWNIYGNIFEYAALFAIVFGGCILAINVVIHKMIQWQTRAHEELKRAADSAIRAEHAKSQFFSSMSHEIRTPINVILGMNEMILRECADEKLLSYAVSIETSGRTLLSLINDVLDISKIESGKMKIVQVEYRPAELFMDLWNMTYLRAQEKGLSVRFEIDEAMPRVLFGDDVRIKQIASNLLTNALKYTHKGGFELRAAYERTGGSKDVLVLSVKDTGIGIRQEDLSRMFESFQRLDETENRSIEGSGLGLSITRTLLRQMDGEMRVESEYRKGSTFTVRIPQRTIDAEPMGNFEAAAGDQARERAADRRLFEAPDARVLAVDDNAMNLTVLGALLRRTKIQIDTAESGKKCLELARKRPYHLIFMDHMMPEMDGVETLHALRELPDSPNAQTPVIILTANALSGAEGEYIAQGFAGFLTKPLDPDLLDQIVMRHLPAELVHPVSGVGSAPAQTPQGKSLLRYGVSVEQGLYYCAGSMDFYLELADVFLEDTQTRQRLEECLNQGDMKAYSVLVHALKGNARTLGAQELADLAYEHELESRAGNAAAVRARWESLCALIDRAKEGLSLLRCEHRAGRPPEGEPPRALPGKKPLALSGEELVRVSDLVADFEFDEAIKTLKRWLQSPLEERTRERVGDALKALEQDFDSDQAIALLRGEAPERA